MSKVAEFHGMEVGSDTARMLYAEEQIRQMGLRVGQKIEIHVHYSWEPVKVTGSYVRMQEGNILVDSAELKEAEPYKDRRRLAHVPLQKVGYLARASRKVA